MYSVMLVMNLGQAFEGGEGSLIDTGENGSGFLFLLSSAERRMMAWEERGLLEEDLG